MELWEHENEVYAEHWSYEEARAKADAKQMAQADDEPLEDWQVKQIEEAAAEWEKERLDALEQKELDRAHEGIGPGEENLFIPF